MNQDAFQQNAFLISVVVPVYNSQDIIEELCKRLEDALKRMCGDKYEIILVDDCSSDGVWTKIKNLAAQKPHITGHRLGNNFGQFMATLAGISKAKGSYVVTIDDDLEYDPADIQKLWDALHKNDYYLVFGIAPDKYRVKNINTMQASLRNKVINFLWQKFLTDSYKIFRRELFFKGDEFGSKLHFEAFVKHSLNERFVGYEQVKYQPRFAGTSNHTSWRKMKILFRYSIEYYKNPAVGFALFSYAFFLLLVLLDCLVWRGAKNGLPDLLIGLNILTVVLIIFHYVSHIYRSTRRIPDYWIIESTGKLK
jgi:glycosyltransferase involved in cell wall biosynthesis